MTQWTVWIVCIAAAYLVGSIPFGVLLGKTVGVDIRRHGSRNIGATNVTRVLGRRLGMTCFLLDVAKGAVPVLAAGFACEVINRTPRELHQAQMWLWLAVAAAAVLGHMFSLFLGLRGGKGVATSFGAVAFMWPLLTLPALGALVVWYAVLRFTRYVSLASMLAAVSLPLGYLLAVIPRQTDDLLRDMLHASPPFIATAVMAALVIWRHRGNIARLMRGEEPKTGGRADILDNGADAPAPPASK